MTTKTKTTPEAPEFPSWWDFDSDGKMIEGAFVRAGQGYTAMGQRAFVVLSVEGVEAHGLAASRRSAQAVRP